MVSRDIIQRLLAIINDTRARLNTLESREVALLTATQTLTNKTLTTPTIGNFTNAQHAHTGATSGGTISHGSLTDLTTGDPHTQYLLESVYDANTILKADADNTPITLTVGASTIVGRAATGNIAALNAAQVATIVQGSIDHGSIAGLTDDDHTGYARLAGRSGGQTLIGGTAANDDLTLEGTSSATRTTSYVVLQPNGGNVGIGTTNPTIAKLQVVGDSTTNKSITSFGQGNSGNYDATISSGFVAGFSTQPSVNVTGNSSNVFGTYCFAGANVGTGVTLTNIYGGYVDSLSKTGSGTITNAYGLYVTAPTVGINNVTAYFGGNVGIGTTSPSRKLHVAGTILIDGDEGGIAGTIGLTDVFDATLSSGNGTVKLKGTTTRDSAGFIKMYVGTTTVWVPYWTNIA